MNILVTLSLTTVLALPAVSCAQERKPVQSQQPADGQEVYRAQEGHGAPDGKATPDDKMPRRLESVTWNSVNHQLIWVIAKGEKQSGGFKATGSESYQISMDTATMTFHGETRRFSKQEAANVHVLMDVIAKYAVDSTIWWDEGQGEPLNGPPAKDKEDPKKPTKDRNILKVGLRTPEGISADAVQGRIDQLQKQIDQLRQLKLMLDHGQAQGARGL